MQHFSAMIFYMGYEKNMSFLMIPKSPKIGKKVEKIGLGSFKTLKTTLALEEFSQVPHPIILKHYRPLLSSKPWREKPLL